MSQAIKTKEQLNEMDKEFQCPYCGDPLSETWSGCCGEAGHGEYVYIDDEGNCFNENGEEL